MPQDLIRLYTWQNPEWDIIKEKRDPSYGPQRWRDTWDKLQLLYEKLEKKVGTLDFVHCYTKYCHWMQDDISRLWELSVPSAKIFQFLDSKIWETMIKDTKNNRQPEDASWNKLIVERSEGIKRLSAGNNGNITPLVLVPLCTSRHVDGSSKFSKGLAIPVKYEDLPTSEREAYYNLGVTYDSLGRHQEAVVAFKQAIRIKPDYAEAHYELGAAYGCLGRFEDVIESCKQAIRIKPDYAKAHCLLGVAYETIGDKGSALEEYKILKTLDTEQANKLFNFIYK